MAAYLKKSMDNRDIVRFHRIIAENSDLEKEAILQYASKTLRIETNTLKKFTPSKVEAAKKKARKIAVDSGKVSVGEIPSGTNIDEKSAEIENAAKAASEGGGQ